MARKGNEMKLFYVFWLVRSSELGEARHALASPRRSQESIGKGIAVQVDHLVPDEVSALVDRIRCEQGKLHILVNDIWGAT